ncbi:MAG: hypothetical protein GC136_06615 [Alphaproteobacteria bacterium]|nr:hypothetical protein [Alphaproteobacteria bacterium]
MRLSEFQDSFKHTMLEPDHLDNDVLRNAFRQDHGICLENRMKVYRNNVVRSLIDAAMAALPMTEKLVGREFLEQAMRAFVVNNLPSQGNLNLYGMEFPDFVQAYEPAKHLPYLQDFTRLEWLWEAAYYAPDDLPLDPAELMNIAEEDMPNLQFSFRKSLALLDSEYPLDEIVDFCRAEDQKNLQQLSDRGCKLMIYRPDLKVELRRLDDAEYLFLATIQNGQTIHETAEILVVHYPDADLTPLLQKHLQLGTFTSFKIRR